MFRKLTILFLLIAVFFGINFISQKPKQQPVLQQSTQEQDFLDDFRNEVDITDGIITDFGNEFMKFLSGETESKDYVTSVKKFRDEIVDVQNTVEKIKPSAKYQKIYDKYKNGISLVLEVLNKNVDYLSADNPDPDLMKDDQEKFSVGLQQIQEVKETLSGNKEMNNKI